MEKALMSGKKGSYEVRVLEKNDGNKKDLIDENVCPNCGEKVEMKGHFHDGQFILFECVNCKNNYAR